MNFPYYCNIIYLIIIIVIILFSFPIFPVSTSNINTTGAFGKIGR